MEIMLHEIITNVKETVLNAYGWHTFEPDDYLDRTIEPGEYVRFFDDELECWSWGVYLGWYQDMNKAKETSPYMHEAYEGVDRLVVQDSVINPDGTVSTRTNYALPENVFDWYEATNTPMSAIEAIAS